MRIAGIFLAAILLAWIHGASSAAPDEERARLIAEVARAANEFLAALPEDRRLAAKLPFENRERTNWRYTPGSRAGLPLQDMAPQQRAAAQALLKSFLSAEGYLKVQSIVALELVARQRNQGATPTPAGDSSRFPTAASAACTIACRSTSKNARRFARVSLRPNPSVPSAT